MDAHSIGADDERARSIGRTRILLKLLLQALYWKYSNISSTCWTWWHTERREERKLKISSAWRESAFRHSQLSTLGCKRYQRRDDTLSLSHSAWLWINNVITTWSERSFKKSDGGERTICMSKISSAPLHTVNGASLIRCENKQLVEWKFVRTTTTSHKKKAHRSDDRRSWQTVFRWEFLMERNQPAKLYTNSVKVVFFVARQIHTRQVVNVSERRRKTFEFLMNELNSRCFSELFFFHS